MLKEDETNRKKYDFVVWIDADAMIMNDSIRLEAFIDSFMRRDNKNFLLNRDNGFQINSGVWFVKNDQYSYDMLSMVYNHENVKQYYIGLGDEQGSFSYLYDRNINDLQNKSVILHTDNQKLFNCSYCYYKTSYFIVHYLGLFVDLNRLEYYIKLMYPHQRDDETEIEYKERYKAVSEKYQQCSWEFDIVIPQRLEKERLEKERLEKERLEKERLEKERAERRSRICVCSFNIGEIYKETTKYGHLSKIQYCKKNGYAFDDDESIYDSSRHPAWSKILLLKKCMLKEDETNRKKYDFVVWIDADAMIMNDEIYLEDFIEKYMSEKSEKSEKREDAEKHFLLSRDNGYRMNTGVWFIRNTDYALKILEKVWENTTNGDT
jgi:hypothetical protein